MDAQNTSKPNVNDVSLLLALQYKLATALLNRSIDPFTSFEKKICSLSVELTKMDNVHKSIDLFLCGIFAEDTDNYLRHTQEISFQDFENNFEAIDDLIHAVVGKVMENHQNRIHKIKQEATKHDF